MRLILDNCWYGEAYGTAQAPGYCVSPIVGSLVKTEHGDVSTSSYGGLLYTRGRPGIFAGQSASGYGNIQCATGDIPRVVGNGYGVNTVLYLRDGTLVQGAPQFGSQGLRYQADDGRIVTGDESHLSPDHLLADYSEMGGVRIGQNQNGAGALVQFQPGSTLRLLEPGDCQFIRVNYYAESDSFAIGIVKLPEQRWVGYWLTRAELEALPVFQPDQPPTEPPTEPPHHPPQEPPIMSLPDPNAVKAALTAARNRYPTPTVSEDQMGEILNRVAGQFADCGMHRKLGQAHQPVTGIGISHDVLRYMPAGDPLGWWADVLGATGAGIATPLAPDWQRSSDGRESFVVPVGGTQPPDPPVPPQPPVSGLTEADVRRIVRDMLSSVAIRSADGHYVCAEGGGGGEVNATRTAAGSWEHFSVETKP